jgi:[ribosomal protein S18]-alanine N-acetyltransferase
MILRAAALSDLPDIMDIEKDAFIPAIQEKKTVFAERIRICSNCFVIFEDETSHETAGYFSAERWDGIPADDTAFTLGHPASKSHHRNGQVLYLSSFALRSTYRGCGFGAGVFCNAVNWFCSHSTGIKTLLLLVNTEWKGALHIYRTYGFTEIRRIPCFFPAPQEPGSDGILMAKPTGDIESCKNRRTGTDD